VLYDGDNPTPDSRYPIHIFSLTPRPTTFWGQSFYPYLYDLQQAIDSVRTSINIHTHFAGGPNLITTENPSQVRAEPGALWKLQVGPDRRTEWATPPPFPSELLMWLQKLQQDFDQISGVQDIVRGVRPKGVTAGVALEGLKQDAMTRLSLAANAWTNTLTGVGQALLDLAQQHLGSGLFAASARGGTPTMASVPPEALTMFVPGENGSQDQAISRRFRVVMQPGGDLPLSQAAQAEIAFRLRQQGDIDTPAMLNAVNFKDRDQVLARQAGQIQAQLQGQQDAMAQAQQAQSGALPPTPPGQGAPIPGQGSGMQPQFEMPPRRWPPPEVMGSTRVPPG